MFYNHRLLNLEIDQIKGTLISLPQFLFILKQKRKKNQSTNFLSRKYLFPKITKRINQKDIPNKQPKYCLKWE